MENKYKIHYSAEVEFEDEVGTVKGSCIVTTKTPFAELEKNIDITNGLESFVGKMYPDSEVINVKFLKAELTPVSVDSLTDNPYEKA